MFHLQITDIIWNPIKDQKNRDYLFLTYGPSSRMEFPESWKERMKIWDDTINALINENKETIIEEIDLNMKTHLNPNMTDPVVDIN